jgi:hypothetical protein
MIDRNQGSHSNSGREAKRHLQESIAIGRISPFEAGVIEQFFASAPSLEWPSSGLERRMQGSGGLEARAASNDSKGDPDRKS